MQTKIMALLLSCLFGVFSAGCQMDSRPSNSVKIDDVRNTSDVPDYSNPEAGDVYVQRTIFLGNGYYVFFFPEQNGQLKEYSAFYGSDDEFDIAYYEWLSETEVQIELVNSETDASIDFVVFGEGAKTGLREETEE